MNTPTPAPMTAEALVYRLVCDALAQDDARGALYRLSGALYDAASRAHDEWADTPRTDALARAFVLRSLADARELRGFAGYVGRVADATPAPDDDYCPHCWCERRDDT